MCAIRVPYKVSARHRYISRSPPYVHNIVPVKKKKKKKTKPGVGHLRNEDDLIAAAGWENDDTP